MEKKVGDYLDKLRPQQRQFILWCVKQWGETDDRRKLNPGLLPFIPVREAIRALQHKLDIEMIPDNPLSDAKEADTLICHSRYIRHIISVLADGDMKLLQNNVVQAAMDLAAPMASTIMQLSSPKVYKLRRSYLSPTFFTLDSVFLNNSGPNVGFSTEVEFLQRSASRWQITCAATYLERVTTILAERCR